MHRNIIHKCLIPLFLLTAVAGWAQDYEVRTFLDAGGTAATSTDDTFQYLLSNVRARYVCPVCSFSRDTAGNCPNPWGITGHGAATLQDLNPLRRQRLLALTPQDMDADKADLLISDINGVLHPRAVLGRPFKPYDFDGNQRRSRLFAQAANLVGASPAISAGMHLRFMVLPPTPLRREAQSNDPGGQDNGLPNRRPMAQVDPGAAAGGSDSWRPHVMALGGSAQPIADADLDGFLQVGLNPYRVDEGDFWWVRYREEAEDVGGGVVEVRRASVEVYSVMYGWQGEVVSGVPTPLLIDPPAAAEVTAFNVVVPSGAVRLSFTAPWSTTDSGGAWNTWTIGFMTRSNCRLIPGWRDMFDPAVDPAYTNLNNVASGLAHPADFDLITDDFPAPKTPSFAAAAGTGPTITTESPIEGTGAAPVPYYLPPNATGLGQIAVQWAGELSGTIAWTPDPLAAMGANPTYRLADDTAEPDDEWQYDVGYDVTNADVAAMTNNFGGRHYVQMLAGRFMCTRPDVLPTGDEWDRDFDATGDEDAETNALEWAYPKAIIGWLSSTGLVYGSFAPGGTTPQRPLTVLNRWDGEGDTHVCASCGGLWGGDRLEPPPPLPAGMILTDPPAQCPYHTNPGIVTVVGAGDTSYNGTYTQEGMYGGQPLYRLDAGHCLYYNTNRWTLAPNPGDPTAYRTQSANRGLVVGTVWRRFGSTPNPAPSSVVRSTSGTSTAVASPLGGGVFTATRDTWRAITAAGQDESMASLPDKRHLLPGEAIRGSGMGVASTSSYATPRREQLSAVIPRYQPPSVPGSGIVNNFTLDRGYRGGQVLYHHLEDVWQDQTLPNTNSALTDGWDVFYKNPDNGYFQPTAGTWPFLVGGRIQFAAANPGGTEVGGRHWYCPTCGSEFRNSVSTCPFDGTQVYNPGNPEQNRIPLNLAVREEHLVAEEYDPFDVQVSVARKGEVAQTTSDVPVGRAAPGVRDRQPDVTTGILTDHRAFPSDVTALPRWPYRASDAKVLLRNEGNVAVGLRLGNTYDFNDAVLADRALDHYLRVDVDPTTSYGRKAGTGPLTRDVFVPRVTGNLAQQHELATATAPSWDALATAPGSPAGLNAYGYITAGSYVGRGTGKPVPLGQPVGTYTGGHLQYVDVDGDGAFDFEYWDGAAWTATDTSARQYNPAIDRSIEPLAGILRGQSRVFESRLPQNDYYARDSDPVVLPTATPGQMQIVWSTNRVSTDPTGTSGLPAGDAGTNQGHIPLPTAPSNLVTITTEGFTGGADDPLYRWYRWPLTVGGVLNSPAAWTTDGPGAINSAPWVMYDHAMGRWGFWHRTQRHTGGVESTLRYFTPANVQSFLYDSGLPKRGLRGFARPEGMWLFWHEGTPGREQLMYRWNFDGTVNNNEALLPVTNVAPAGATDLVTTNLPEGGTGTIRRSGASPFGSTKDVSVFRNADTAHVFFSGFVNREGQADICWTQYDIPSLANRPGDPRGLTNNHGKLPFRRITDDEEMATDGYHQTFGSRHLDWLVGETFAAAPGGGISPTFELRLAFAGQPAQRFELLWDTPSTSRNVYDRARGTYRVTPILRPIGGSSLSGYGIDEPGGGWYLQDPNGTAGQRLAMEINPAAGTVLFSSPLYDEDVPGNPRAALRRGALLPGLRDVAVCVNYTPYVYRVTASGAQDDAPSASYDSDTTGRLVVFWRRSYPTTEAPHFGRPAFMYKVYTTSVQVGRPPVTSWDVISGNTQPVTTNDNAGIVTADPTDIRRYLNIDYTSGGRAYTERHQVTGWSREMVVPVDTVVGEGAPVAVPEVFSVPATDPADPAVTVPAVRYWLYWSSPRGVYDVRLVEDPNGTRAVGPPHDVAVHPSSDIYTAVVAPDFGSLAPERTVRAVPVP